MSFHASLVIPPRVAAKGTHETKVETINGMDVVIGSEAERSREDHEHISHCQ